MKIKYLLLSVLLFFFLGVQEGEYKYRMGKVDFSDDIVKYQQNEIFLIGDYLPAVRKTLLSEEISVQTLKNSQLPRFDGQGFLYEE
ncbi:MAG: hypothetical protein QXV73_04200 [Candidatus Micrarchaeia archaeon]